MGSITSLRAYSRDQFIIFPGHQFHDCVAPYGRGLHLNIGDLLAIVNADTGAHYPRYSRSNRQLIGRHFGSDMRMGY